MLERLLVLYLLAASPMPKATRLSEAETATLLGKEQLSSSTRRGLEPMHCPDDLRDVAAQSFRLTVQGSVHDGAIIAAFECYGGGRWWVAFAEFRQGKFVQVLPDHPANNWDTYEIESVTFLDLNGDGNFDVLAIVSTMPGHGPHGAEPFPVGGVWLGQNDGTFVLDSNANKHLLHTPTVKAALQKLKGIYKTR